MHSDNFVFLKSIVLGANGLARAGNRQTMTIRCERLMFVFAIYELQIQIGEPLCEQVTTQTAREIFLYRGKKKLFVQKKLRELARL